MKLFKSMLFVCFFCLSATAFGQDTEKTLAKPWQSWSQDEASKLILNKPFADQYQSTQGLVSGSVQQQRVEQSDTRMSGQERGRTGVQTIAPIVIRLHSSLPVRQAMVRLRQINSGYDKMSEEDRKKFDETQKVLLNCAVCTNYYVVTIMKRGKTEGVDDGFFQTMKLEDLKDKIWLINDKNEKRELEQFTPPKGAGDMAVFFFKRNDEKGNPLITTETKFFKFVFSNDLLDGNNAYSALMPRNFEFKVSKLVINNKVEF